jgi:hypothetical protein
MKKGVHDPMNAYSHDPENAPGGDQGGSGSGASNMSTAQVTAPRAMSEPSRPDRGQMLGTKLLERYLVWRRGKRPVKREGRPIAVNPWDFLTNRTLAAMHSIMGRVQSGDVSVSDTRLFFEEVEQSRDKKLPVKVSVAAESLGNLDPAAPPDPETVERQDDRSQVIKDAVARVRRKFEKSNKGLYLKIFNAVWKTSTKPPTHDEVAKAAGCSVSTVDHALRAAERILLDTLTRREAALVIKINRKPGRPSHGAS